MKFDLTPEGEVKTGVPLSESLAIVKKCFENLGVVTESNENAISGWIRYGLQRVKVRVSWRSTDSETVFVIQSSSDDLWNFGGKNAKKRLIELIRNHSNKGFYIDSLGLPRATLAGQIILFIVIVIVVIHFFN